MSCVEEYARNCKVLLDIGANCGVETDSLVIGSTKSHASPTIYAFEPHNEVYQILYNKYKDSPYVNTFNVAISDTIGISTLQYKNNDLRDNSYGGSTIVPELFSPDRLGNDTLTQMVMTTTIDSLNLNPDYIKIDAEGSESNIFIGGKNQIIKNKPVIIFEYGSSEPPENFQPKSIEILRSYGYTKFIESETGSHRLTGDFDFRHPCSPIDILALCEK